jgi:small ligand-binding sensory domain FIST
MRHAAGSSTDFDTRVAVAEACAQACEQLDGDAVTLAMVFFTPHHAPEVELVAQTVLEQAEPRRLLGCTAENLIAGPHEIAGAPAVTVWLASWPDAAVDAFHLVPEGSPSAPAFDGWPDPMPSPSENPAFLLLADPFTVPVDALLGRLNRDYPGCPAFGGLASGGWTPGMNRLIVDEVIYDRGVAGLAVTGGLKVETIVSQGVRPIGKPFVITKSDRNLLLELGGRPALQQLQDVFESLPESEQALVQRALHVGQVIDERKEQFARDDFLVRNIMGIDPEAGAIAITEAIRPGRTVQFQVRDAASAKEDLRSLLQQRAAAGALPDGAGALFISCNGRGAHLFGETDQDSGALADALGPVPTAGFFAAGEIGPVGGTNFLHGFTASIALFQPV